MADKIAPGETFWTCASVPESAQSFWRPRSDQYIGLLELCAVGLWVGTFGDQLRGSDSTVYVDNDGVLGAFLKGSMKCPDGNWMIGLVWLQLARLNIRVMFGRVESKANISDGPTRGRQRDIRTIQGQWVSPVWPLWLREWWAVPEP